MFTRIRDELCNRRSRAAEKKIHLWRTYSTWLGLHWVMSVFIKRASYIWPLETDPSSPANVMRFAKNVTPSPIDSMHNLYSAWTGCYLLPLHTFLYSYQKILHNTLKAAYYVTVLRRVTITHTVSCLLCPASAWLQIKWTSVNSPLNLLLNKVK